jgi:hypothetical protein
MLPEKIDRFLIEKELTRGRSGPVYLGRAPISEQAVVIRLLVAPHPLDGAEQAEFSAAATQLARLAHPAIVPLIGSGWHDGRPFLVSPYLPGGTLRDRLGQPWSVSQVIAFLNRVSLALDMIHAAGMIHGNVRPENILYDEANQPYLADLGLVQMAEFLGQLPLESDPAYTSPEQITGPRPPDERIDVYALGLIVFEMLTGRRPFQADDPEALRQQHVDQPVPDILELRPDLPLRCRSIMQKAMAKWPEARYQSASALATAVFGLDESHLEAIVAATDSGTPEPSKVTEIQAPIRPAGREAPDFEGPDVEKPAAGEPTAGRRTRLSRTTIAILFVLLLLIALGIVGVLRRGGVVTATPTAGASGVTASLAAGTSRPSPTPRDTPTRAASPTSTDQPAAPTAVPAAITESPATQPAATPLPALVDERYLLAVDAASPADQRQRLLTLVNSNLQALLAAGGLIDEGGPATLTLGESASLAEVTNQRQAAFGMVLAIAGDSGSYEIQPTIYLADVEERFGPAAADLQAAAEGLLAPFTSSSMADAATATAERLAAIIYAAAAFEAKQAEEYDSCAGHFLAVLALLDRLDLNLEQAEFGHLGLAGCLAAAEDLDIVEPEGTVPPAYYLARAIAANTLELPEEAGAALGQCVDEIGDDPTGYRGELLEACQTLLGDDDGEAASTPEPTPIAGRTQARVMFASVNLRNGPGTGYFAFRFLFEDDLVTVVGTTEGLTWYNVSLDDGTLGWLAASVVELLDPAGLDNVPVAATIPPTPTPTVTPAAPEPTG